MSETNLTVRWFSETLNDKGFWETDPGAYIPGQYTDLLLFGLLADILTSRKWNVAARGFPADASQEILERFKESGVYVHAPSFMTREELMYLRAMLNTLRTQYLMEGGRAELEGTSIWEVSHLISRVEDLIYYMEQASQMPGVAADRQRLVYWFI